MYRGRLWTMRQYAGFGTAAESNARYRYLLAQGVSGLSVAFDLPTQMGYDSDHPMAGGEVGRVGVAIDSIEDMATLFDGIPLDRVSTSMTINSTAIILLALYVAVARRQGVPLAQLSGTIQNDILKEYIARGTYIYPPRHSLRIVTDIFAWCERELPNWNTISISGYHIREAGSTAVQEVAFTLANAIAYVEAARDAGLDVNRARPAAVVLLQRAQRLHRGGRQVPRGAPAVGASSCATASARRTRAPCSCASTPRRPAARSPPSSRTTTSSASPSRRWRRCSAARSRCTATAATRRWRCRPRRPRASRCRTQQVIASESGVANTVDPLGGAWAVEERTTRIEREARELIATIDAAGGTLAAIEAGRIQRQVQDAAYAAQQAIDRGDQVIVGVNEYQTDEPVSIELLRIDPESERRQVEAVRAVRQGRDAAAWKSAIDAVERAARDGSNLVPPVLAAVEARGTLGEIADALRRVFGEHRDITT